MIRYIFGADLLGCDFIQLIAHQTNCVSKKGKGLSASISKKFPYADFYSDRIQPSTPGTIEVRGGGTPRDKFVCGMYAQYYPGGSDDSRGDGALQRIEWFRGCLDKIKKIKNLRSIGFPYNIGCGLAKGDWKTYRLMLENFAKELGSNVEVYVVSLETIESIINTDVEYFTDLCLVDTPTYQTEDIERYMWDNTPDGWDDFFNVQLGADYASLPDICRALSADTKYGHTIYPPLDMIFSIFHMLKPENVKVLIIGQDPYHDDGQAKGIAFSVPDGVPPPPSLKNIYTELQNDGFVVSDPTSGNIDVWVDQGVFLVNTALTVIAHTPGSHSEIWTKHFTPTLMEYLNNECEDLVIILWGNHAKGYAKYFGDRHKKITSPHPSPLSAHRGFFGSKPFSKTNTFLEKMSKEPIDWNL
jgi:uracil-DNA glycosylase